MRAALRVSCTLVLAVTATGSANACNIPVFRYALENWRPDAYRVTVFHRDPLSEADAALIHEWQSARKAARLNADVRAISAASLESDADRARWEQVQSAALPVAVVQYPSHLHNETPLWAGDLGALSQQFDSPLRRELVRRLVGGDTAVWLLVETGDPAQDETALNTLQQELPRLQTILKLPELTDSPDDILRGSTPLRIGFSVLRVRRDDPAEAALVNMLLGSEADLAGLSQPLAFPVFGRGRALFALVGRGISAENIRSSAAFLTGACSCQVKEQNPGFDILITADWTDLLSLTEPVLEVATTAMPVTPELVPIASGATALNVAVPSATSDSAPDRGLWSISIYGLVLAGCAMIVAWRR
jgi:hypothetical protein